jgi:hypothetical protein
MGGSLIWRTSGGIRFPLVDTEWVVKDIVFAAKYPKRARMIQK